ncbi:hypothetical protein GCM10010344_12410 [Streptomyces bluensis]|nr:hypothetical protein GCM10010344_12410 [Streptomyces bluensis]
MPPVPITATSGRFPFPLPGCALALDNAATAAMANVLSRAAVRWAILTFGIPHELTWCEEAGG